MLLSASSRLAAGVARAVSASSRLSLACPALTAVGRTTHGAGSQLAAAAAVASSKQQFTAPRSLTTMRAAAADMDYSEEERFASDLRQGYVYDGVVRTIKPYGAFVELPDGTNGLLHISQISNEYLESLDGVLAENEAVKVLVLKIDRYENRISLSTKRLESSPGQMLTDRQGVWDGAEDAAAAVRQEWADRRAQREAEGQGERRSWGDGERRGGGRGGGGRGGGRGYGGRGGGGGGGRGRREWQD